MKLYDWHLLIQETIRTQNNVSFIFVIHAKNFEEVSAFAIKNKFRHVLLYDKSNLFAKVNPYLPRQAEFQTFLLDREHKIKLVGNPVKNKPLWELYQKQMGHEKDTRTGNKNTRTDT